MTRSLGPVMNDGQDFAEMTADEKATMSHRATAMWSLPRCGRGSRRIRLCYETGQPGWAL